MCVMKLDGKSFGGDVVLESFNMTSREDDSILDKIYQEQIFSDLYDKDFIF